MTDPSLRPPSGLYQKLLGDSWGSLNQSVQWLHLVDAPVHASGMFRVRQGSNWLSRTLARLAQLPTAGESVAIELIVTERGDGEEWRRTFAGRPFVSLQYQRPDGLLVERVGAVEIWFGLRVVEGALAYQATRAALCVGSLRVPIPRWLGPRITALETPIGERDQIDISVEVHLPLLGRLIAYQGMLTQVDAHND